MVLEQNIDAQLLRALVDQFNCAVYIKDQQGTYTYANAMVCRLFKCAAADIIGHDDSDLFPPDVAALFSNEDRTIMATGQPLSREETLTFPDDDDTHHFWVIKQPLRNSAGEIAGIAGMSIDIHALKQKEQQLSALQHHFQATLNAMPDLMFELDLDGRYLDYHSPREELLAAPPDQIMGHTINEILPPPAADTCFEALHEALNQGYSSGKQFQLDLPHGSCWFELSVARKQTLAGETPSFIVLSRDITSRKEAEQQIRSLAFYDSLTALPNRRLMFDRLDHALPRAGRHNRQGALLLIDLDNFKQLNDTMGHDAGDQLLQEVAQRLTAGIRREDTASRLGGDEFVVILEDMDPGETGVMQAKRIAHALQARLRVPFTLSLAGEHRSFSHQCSCSIGIALFQDEHISGEELMRRADTAMYQAKAAGRNCARFFDPGMQAVVAARAALETDLRNAIKKSQFLLHFQSQVNTEGRCTGAEALIRWHHPQRGLVTPEDFISAAEETGLIIALGHWVLETACLQLATWEQHPATADLTLAVNVSARQFHQPHFYEELQQILITTNAPPQRLKLELTESLLLEHSDAVIQRILELKTLGIGFSLDDFGTGYSSLSYLKRLPLDQLKIDRTFIRDILSDPNDAIIARTIVALGDSMGLEVIAEGVETQAQREMLARSGCHYYQGYLFGHPMDIRQFEASLQYATSSSC